MTFLEALGGIAGEAGAGGVNIGRNMLAPLITQGLGEGLSANSMLSAVRGAGFGIRRSSFLELVGSVRDAMTASPVIAGAPLDRLPDANAIVDWRGGKAGTYLYRLNVFTRERDESGVFQITSVAWDIQTSELVTPEEAIATMTEQWNTNTEDYPLELLGATVRGVYRQTGHRAA
jgi:hypothetical protein